MEIKLVGRTVELTEEQMKEEERKYKEEHGIEKSYAQIMRYEFLISSGKAAGICYMPDDYLENGIQNEEKAYKRGVSTLASGHKTVGEHDHVSFIMKVPKIICIILNSIQIYNTSEKSSRYTIMKNLEGERLQSYTLYKKWSTKFQDVIREQYPNKYTDKEIEKLALENARYFLSIFNVESVLKYTVSYAECYMIIYYMEELLKDINNYYNSSVYEFRQKQMSRFLIPLEKTVKTFLEEFKNTLGITEMIIPNNKSRYLYLLRYLRYPEEKPISNDGKHYPYYGDVYNTVYDMSFAAFGQEQRHRTLKHRIIYPTIGNYSFNPFYIPPILDNEFSLKTEWIDDWNSLLGSTTEDVYQGEYVSVIESGHFEDFILKCEERLCSRAQLEICRQTGETLLCFIENAENLSGLYRMELQDWVTVDLLVYGNITPKNRCNACRFKCKEGCKSKDINPLDRII